MFSGAAAFNQNISSWNVASIANICLPAAESTGDFVIGRHALACTLLFVATFLGLRSLAKSNSV